ncbi:hypothetical protein GTY54_51170 [Streptomyces sp. SID625]|nr:hypothetical protein [Streptomyces sp. SID625]
MAAAVPRPPVDADPPQGFEGPQYPAHRARVQRLAGLLPGPVPQHLAKVGKGDAVAGGRGVREG